MTSKAMTVMVTRKVKIKKNKTYARLELGSPAPLASRITTELLRMR
jgi:hypothetical protein